MSNTKPREAGDSSSSVPDHETKEPPKHQLTAWTAPSQGYNHLTRQQCEESNEPEPNLKHTHTPDVTWQARLG